MISCPMYCAGNIDPHYGLKGNGYGVHSRFLSAVIGVWGAFASQVCSSVLRGSQLCLVVVVLVLHLG